MICYICGRRLLQAVTKKIVPGVEYIVDGQSLRAHKGCAESEKFQSDTDKIPGIVKQATGLYGEDGDFKPRKTQRSA